ncbi:MAG: hypothetical protein VX951_13860 [Planctomycetota bacterium]|nr:hypothetical protein [Planctomycetota bacterium]
MPRARYVATLFLFVQPEMLFWSRLFWIPLHLLWSGLALGASVLFRRGGTLVFTHYHDIDADGRDQQMGPLVDSLIDSGANLVEISRIPLGPAFLDACRLKRRLFISQAALLVPAWLLSMGDTRRAARISRMTARCLLRLLRPRVLYLIDESGSGQPLLRAARSLGIRVVGIQHGDFADNPQYCAGPGFDREPADTLCVWSSWYRDRLLEVSPVYTDCNVEVTGRLRYPDEPGSRTDTAGDAIRILVIGERGAAFWAAIDPFVQALTQCEEFLVDLRLHPSDVVRRTAAASRSLVAALRDADVVIGSGSSALVEAIYWRRPVVVCALGQLGDPAGLVRDELALGCHNPADLGPLCANLNRPERAEHCQNSHAMVWGDVDVDAVQEILAAGVSSRSSGGAPHAEIV